MVTLAFCNATSGARQPAAPREFFVAPNGSASGRGTFEDPWDLQTALDQPPSLRPGHVVWMRGGTYAGAFTSRLTGTPTSPITLRQYPGERATLDGGNSHGKAILTISGAYATYWGFEIMSSDPSRLSTTTSSDPPDVGRGEAVVIDQTEGSGVGTRFVNLIVHDARQGFSFWKEAVDAQIRGCLIYYNGWDGPDRGHGHGIYVQNRAGTKHIDDNVIFEQFSHGIHGYGSSNAFLDDIEAVGNTLFNNGSLSKFGASRNLLIGGGSVTHNPTVAQNALYYPQPGPGSALRLGYVAGCENARVEGNYVANETLFTDCQPSTLDGNTFLGATAGIQAAAYPDNTFATAPPPSGTRVFVRPNQDEPGRANVTVFNWDLQDTVSADLSTVLSPGDEFEVRNVQDFFGAPVVEGTYDGGPVALPMKGLSVAAPVGWPAPPPTGPEFNAFVVLRKGSARAEPGEPQPGPRAPRKISRAADAP